MAKNKQVKHRDKKASKRSRIFATLIAFIMVAALGQVSAEVAGLAVPKLAVRDLMETHRRVLGY